MDALRPPPEVTVRDPARPGLALDVLVLGDAQPASRSWTPRHRRRATALLAVVALAVAAAGALDRRADAERERRDAGAVDLAAEPGASVTARRSDTGTTLRHVVRLRNDGPREVTVLTGGIGDYGVVHEVVVQPDREAPLLLEQFVACVPDPQASSARARTLSLAVQTDAGLRQTRIGLGQPIPDAPSGRPCAATLDRDVSLSLTDATSGRGSVRIAFDARTRARQPVVVVGVAVGPGFAVRLDAPAPVGLPLPVDDIGVGVVDLVAEVTVDDCDAAESFRDSGGPGVLTARFRDGDGNDALAALRYDPRLLAALVGQAC